MWTEGGSKHCDAEQHGKCDGIARVIDQDGFSNYVCTCWCHKAQGINPTQEEK